MSKRRRAREMAIQMLYQSDLGQESCERVLADFKPGDYLNEEREDAPPSKSRRVPPRELSARGLAELESGLEYAKTLVR